MSNGRVDDAQVEAIVSGEPEKLLRFLVENGLQLRAKVDSIAQHCRYCTDDADAGKAEPAAEPDRHTWVMWGVGRWLLDRVLAVAIAAVLTCVITLALTGQL